MDSLTASPVPVSTPILIAFGLEAPRRSVQMGLKDAGYDVVETAATASTIAYLHFAQVPHVVLLDFWLPPGTAEPLLHVSELDAALQRHRYVLTLRPDRLPPTFSAEAERLIHAVCTNVLENPLDTDQLLAAIAQSSGITASQRGESLPLRREHNHHRHNPGALSAALTQVARRLHLSGRG